MEMPAAGTGYIEFPTAKAPIRAWTHGVPVGPEAMRQAYNVASLPFIHRHIALMPDVHVGAGATVGAVIPTVKAIVPAAVGCDIGCGMVAEQTSLTAVDLPDNLASLRIDIEQRIPHGPSRRSGGGRFTRLSAQARKRWGDSWQRAASMADGLDHIVSGIPVLERQSARAAYELGTLGGGNHFVEICLDESDRVWVMLHSGSRGIGNAIGKYFIERAKEDVKRNNAHLPDRNLAYLKEGAAHFDDYVRAVLWAQDYASANRQLMLEQAMQALAKHTKAFQRKCKAVNCHHNYVQRERHFGKEVWVTRKGAVRVRKHELGIIPGSMGAKSYIVRGKGNADAFDSCAHGAGREFSRSEAKELFTLEDHALATEGIECRKDAGVLDETPGAYKDVDAVMAAQKDLVAVEHTLRQIVNVKG